MLVALSKKILKGPNQPLIAAYQNAFLIFSICFAYFNEHLFLCLIIGWLLGWFGGVIIAHRWYSHKYFSVRFKATEIIFHIIYNMTLIGSIISYKYQHALHHKHNEDVTADPHTPNRKGFFLTSLGFYGNVWAHDKKLWIIFLRENNMGRFFHEYYFLAPLLVFSILSFTKPEYIPLLITIISVSWQTIQLKIATLHWNLWGAKKNYPCGGLNIYWLKPILLGDELHNNHHFDYKLKNMMAKKNWKEFDPSYYICRAIEKIC